MNLDKSISYSMTLTSEEVTALVVELHQLFKARPALAKALVNLKILGDALNGRLAIQDYNPKFVQNLADGLMQRGFDSAIATLPEAPKAIEAEAASVSSTVEGGLPVESKSERKRKAVLSQVKKEA